MTMGDALTSAKLQSAERTVLGFDQAALDEAARQGFAEGSFEESEEEGAAVVEEFYPDSLEVEATTNSLCTKNKVGLAEKLNQKASQAKIGAGI